MLSICDASWQFIFEVGTRHVDIDVSNNTDDDDEIVTRDNDDITSPIFLLILTLFYPDSPKYISTGSL